MKDDIYLPFPCTICGTQTIIIPKHGNFPQHEDASLEALHAVELETPDWVRLIQLTLFCVVVIAIFYLITAPSL